MESKFILFIHAWKNGTLVREVEEFIYEEEAYIRIKAIEFFDSLKLTDNRGMVIHEQRNPVPPAKHHRHKHHGHKHAEHQGHHRHHEDHDADDHYA